MNCRFLYLIGELHTGGAERQLYYLLRGMDREYYRPAVVVWNYGDNDSHVAKIKALSVPIYSFPSQLSSVAKLISFRYLVRKLEPMLVHSYSFYTNFAAQWAIQGTRIIAVGSIRSDFAWAKQQCNPVLARLSARWPRNQICNSYSAAQSVRSSSSFFTPTRLSVVHNGLDLESFHNIMAPADHLTRILGIGYLLPVKRWDRLLVATDALKKKGLNFTLQIVGDGPLQPALERQVAELMISERVQFLGHVDNVQCLLAQASFVVHTADSEGCPNSVMEAMACGRAVVATDAGDIPLLVDHGKTGFVVSRDDADALAECIARLITDRDLSNNMGKAGRVKAEHEFGLESLVNETFAVYRMSGWDS